MFRAASSVAVFVRVPNASQSDYIEHIDWQDAEQVTHHDDGKYGRIRHQTKGEAQQAKAAQLVEQLGARSIVLIGLMGCGKSSVGRRLAVRLGLPFVDADTEIELAAAKTIPEIFTDYGEAHFRDREHKIIMRLLGNGPQVLATGGGAYMRGDTRDAIRADGISVWLRAELPVLMRRVMRREDRPLLQTRDPEATMRGLMDARYPVYGQADLTVESREVSHEVVVGEITAALAAGPLAAQSDSD